MKSYPTIPHWHKGIYGEHVYGFNKLDGSNIRAEWNKKRGWYKFGTRNMIINEQHPHFGESVDLFFDSCDLATSLVPAEVRYRLQNWAEKIVLSDRSFYSLTGSSYLGSCRKEVKSRWKG